MPSYADIQSTLQLSTYVNNLFSYKEPKYYPVLASRNVSSAFANCSLGNLGSGNFYACAALDYTGSGIFNEVYTSLFEPRVFDLLFKRENFLVENSISNNPAYHIQQFVDKWHTTSFKILKGQFNPESNYATKVYQFILVCFLLNMAQEYMYQIHDSNSYNTIYALPDGVIYSERALPDNRPTVSPNAIPEPVYRAILSKLTHDNLIKYITSQNFIRDMNTRATCCNSILPILIQEPNGIVKAPLETVIIPEHNATFGRCQYYYTAIPVVNSAGKIVLKTLPRRELNPAEANSVHRFSHLSMIDFSDISQEATLRDDDDEDDEEDEDENHISSNPLSFSHNSRFPELTGFTHYVVENGVLTPKTTPIPKSARFFGIEYECYFTQPQLYGAALRYIHSIAGGFFSSKSDGSLGSYYLPREIISSPAPIEAHRLAWQQFFNTMGKYTLVSLSGSTGGHIHFNRRTLSVLDIGKLTRFLDRTPPIETANFIFGRSTNEYCRVQNRELDTVLFRDSFSNPNGGRYATLNLTGINQQTIEVRLFKGGARYEIIMKNLEFLEAIFKYCETHIIKACEWNNFFSWLTTQSDYPHLTNLLALTRFINAPISPNASAFLGDYQE